MHVRFYLLGFLRALSRPRPVVLQLVKTFPRHRIRSQSGHLSLRFEGKGRLLFFSPFDGARRGKKKKKLLVVHETPTFLPSSDLCSLEIDPIRTPRFSFSVLPVLFSQRKRERERLSSKFRIRESSKNELREALVKSFRIRL